MKNQIIFQLDLSLKKGMIVKMKDSTKYFIIFLLIAVLAVIIYITTKEDSSTETATDTSSYSETTVVKTDIINSLSDSSYVATGLEEKKTLHNTYYFKKIYYEINQQIKEGENIIKYTNGKYLTAPYDCVITEISIPDEGEVCTDKHYIVIQSTNTLSISSSVDEDELSKISVGQEAEITIEALNKTVTGYVTKIDNSGTYSSSGSKFAVTITFENNGKILLGMTAKCSIILEKAENVIAVAKEAITTSNGKSYVKLKDLDGSLKQTEITTGISNDAYTEVKTGLNEGDIVYIEKSTSSSNGSNFRNRQFQGMNSGNSKGERSFQGGDRSGKQNGNN